MGQGIIRALRAESQGFDGATHPPLGDVPYYDGVPSVYVMAMVGSPFLKVGMATNVHDRRTAIQGPFDVDIRHVRNTFFKEKALFIEKAAHTILAPWSHKNEWFTASVARAVAAINEAACFCPQRRWKA